MRTYVSEVIEASIDPAVDVALQALVPPLAWRAPGVTGNYVETADSSAFNPTTSLDVRVAVALDDWIPATVQTLVSKSAGGTAQSWALDIDTVGHMRLSTSADGTTMLVATSNVVPVLDAQLIAVRAVWAAATPSVTFYTKATTFGTAVGDLASNAGWTQLGSEVTGASVAASIADTTATVQVGQLGGGASQLPATGDFCAVRILVDGTSVAELNPSAPAARYIGNTLKTWLYVGSSQGFTKRTGPALETFEIAGQDAELLVPLDYQNGHLVVYHHGSGEDETAFRQSSDKAGIRAALLEAGYMVATSNAHGKNWGNQDAVNDYAALIDEVATITSYSKVLHLAQSMGGMASLVGIAQDAFQADGWCGIFPACNLAAEYALTFTANIRTAYGFTTDGEYAAATAGHDPALFSGVAYTGLRMRFYASPSDVTVPKATNTDVMAAIVAPYAAESAVVLCSGVHGDASHFKPADVVAFFARCVA